MPSESMLLRAGLWRGARAACACALAAALCAGLLPGPAAAEVRRSDEVAGGTVQDRSLTASVCPSIEAQHAILVDAQGEVFFKRDAEASANIASITKVMTAVIAMEEAPLDARIRVSAAAAQVGESTAGLRPGDTLSLEDALKGLMIPSGNDAAIAIAETLGRDMAGTEDDAAGEDAFIAAMNAKAQELGCTETVFENPHGLDFAGFAGDLQSTASDVSTIVAYAMEKELFRQIVDMRSAMLAVDRDGTPVSVEVTTTDELLGNYEGACGVKTGFTDLAGACFAGACERDGQMLYAIVLDAPSESQRFTDTVTLYNWFYDHHVSYKLANDDEMVRANLNGEAREVPVVADVAMATWPDKTVKATFADPDAAVDIFTLYGNVSQSFEFFEPSGAVEPGDVVGRASFYQRNELISEVDVVACEAVPAPTLLEAAQIGWGRFMGLFTGEAAKAESVVLNHTPTVI